MTALCCPGCRLRFTRAAGRYLVACPECGEPPQTAASLELALGFRLFELEEVPPQLPEALAVAISLPTHLEGASDSACSGFPKDSAPENR
jgi:hypothetical protein